MKHIILGAACILAATTFGSLPAKADDSVPLERYHYGMQLDVRKVLSLQEEPAQLCQLVNARMDYLDSQGQRRSVAYLKHSSACRDSN